MILFHSSGCMPCKQLLPIMQAKAQEFDAIEFYSLKIDDHQDFYKSLKIEYVPTQFFITRNGTCGKVIGGAQDKIDKALQALVHDVPSPATHIT